MIQELKDTVMQLKADQTTSKFCIENIFKMASWSHYTQSFSQFKVVMTAVNSLMYWESKDKDVGYRKTKLSLTSMSSLVLGIV